MKKWRLKIMQYTLELEQLDEIDLAWLAGIIDGEGCISAYKSRQKNRKNPSWHPFRYRSELRIYNTDPRIINKATEIIGKGKGLKVYITGPYKEHHKKEYHLSVTGYKLEALLKKIIPYLVAKREQAEIILKWRESRRHAGRLKGQDHVGGRAHYSPKEVALVQRLYALNKKGV